MQMGFISSSAWMVDHATHSSLHIEERLQLIEVGIIEKKNEETNFVLWKTKTKRVPFKVAVEMDGKGVTGYKEPLARSKRC